MRRYHCILTGSCMLLDTFVYSLPFTFALSLLFCSVVSTERLEKVTLLSTKICLGEYFSLARETQQILRLLLQCHIYVLKDIKHVLKTKRIRNTFICNKNLRARKIVHKTVEMNLKLMQFSKLTLLVLQNTESNTLSNELVLRIHRFINGKM